MEWDKGNIHKMTDDEIRAGCEEDLDDLYACVSEPDAVLDYIIHLVTTIRDLEKG